MNRPEFTDTTIKHDVAGSEALAFPSAGSRKGFEERLGCVGEVADEPLPACQDRGLGGDARSRKRMQKVVYLLQVAGCPLEADYTLHHYGPYSQDVARLTDEMVEASLLDEKTTSNAVGQQYSYSLSEKHAAALARIRGDPAWTGSGGGPRIRSCRKASGSCRPT